MDEREMRRQKLLRDLAERFSHSSDIMRQVARRIGEAAAASGANRRDLEKISAPLRKCVGAKTSSLPFSYREFVEFTSAEEFARFRDLAPVTEEDIEKIDWDGLSRDLLKD
ncbi:MAG: hypothetical protein LBE84_06225 [Planctomycetota bacterium]|jgi:hypothetical protein|nr:hypothetical protein [Planctomycetota bacterium]